VTKLLIHPLEPLIFAGTVDGAVRCLDLRSGDPVKEFTGPELFPNMNHYNVWNCFLAGNRSGIISLYESLHTVYRSGVVPYMYNLFPYMSHYRTH
jgi:hypothetical protein